jgi:hypothetical protein
VNVQVLDFLPSVRANIHQRPVTGLADPQMAGHAHDELEKCVTLTVLPSIHIVERDDMLPGYDEYMLGGLRIDIAESDESIVLKDPVAWYVPACDPTEKAVIHDR